MSNTLKKLEDEKIKIEQDKNYREQASNILKKLGDAKRKKEKINNRPAIEISNKEPIKTIVANEEEIKPKMTKAGKLDMRFFGKGRAKGKNPAKSRNKVYKMNIISKKR